MRAKLRRFKHLTQQTSPHSLAHHTINSEVFHQQKQSMEGNTKNNQRKGNNCKAAARVGDKCEKLQTSWKKPRKTSLLQHCNHRELKQVVVFETQIAELGQKLIEERFGTEGNKQELGTMESAGERVGNGGGGIVHDRILFIEIGSWNSKVKVGTEGGCESTRREVKMMLNEVKVLKIVLWVDEGE